MYVAYRIDLKKSLDRQIELCKQLYRERFGREPKEYIVGPDVFEHMIVQKGQIYIKL